jgi:predicted dehydrogenase
MSLRILVVGCGAVAQRLYGQPLQQLEKAGLLRVAGLVDPVASHAAAMRSRFPSATTHADAASALATTRPDVTMVLSSAHLHAEHTLLALQAGSHVLCEKPMAQTSAECGRMTAAARAANRILAIAMIRRFFPAFAQFKALIESGRLGTLRAFEYREGHKFEWDVTTPAAFRRRHEGGTGVLFDIGPHALDHLAWTFGPLSVVDYADDALSGIESNLTMRVRSTRCPGSIQLSWDNPLTNELRVTGDRGEAVLRIDRFDQLAIRESDGWAVIPVTADFPADLAAAGGRRLSPRSYVQAMSCQIVQVLRSIVLGEAPAVDGESGRRTIAALEAGLASAVPLEMPWLPQRERQAFAQLHWNHTR